MSILRAREKLAHVLVDGLGTAMNSWLAPRVAAAQVAEKRIHLLAATEFDRLYAAKNKQFDALYPQSKPNENASAAIEPDAPDDIMPLIARAKARAEYQEAKRQHNVERVAQEAFEGLGEDVSEEPVDDDWIARFLSTVQDVSNEDMQKLWGRLLAGEVTRPGRFSLRTLDALRNLTSTEAQAFEYYCQYCTQAGEIIVPSGEEFYRLCQLDIRGITRLIECGLFHVSQPFLFSAIKAPILASFVFDNKHVHIRSRALGRWTWHGTMWGMTAVGRELRSLREHSLDETFLWAVQIAAENKGLEVLIEGITADGKPPAPEASPQASSPSDGDAVMDGSEGPTGGGERPLGGEGAA